MRIAAGVVVLAGLLNSAAALGGEAPRTWSAIKVPVAGPAAAIGSPAAGCMAGAMALPFEGEGYQVLRLDRNRYWGHPDTVTFVQDLGGAAKSQGLGLLLVGDMSQPRGGPMAFGHGSHQTGLDVDIWFRKEAAPLPVEERERPIAISMVKGNGVDRGAWTPDHLRLLELAASHPRVDRIFVNPAIKAEACRAAIRDRGADRRWLSRLRPWWGHDSHFHVRLACPAGDAHCIPQAAIPDGDGCGAELASWSGKPTILPPGDRPNTRRPVLPASCKELVPGR